MIEENLQRRLEEKHLLLAKEQGHIRLTEEGADYWVWVQVGEEVDRTELEALELKESEFYEGLKIDEIDGVPEGDFGDRVVIDYRPLNAVTKAADQSPMPRIDDILDRMIGSLYFSVVNVKSAYHTIPVAEEDIPKTAFVISFGQYEYLRVPFAGEGSSSSVEGEGEEGDNGEQEGGADAHEPEEMSSNTVKREGEEEGEVRQAESEECEEGDSGEEEEGSEEEGVKPSHCLLLP
ncbi:unnamed protein product [Closterium sp. NIES-64]|nr:unnamed protein product [Closterium sp. NIES-64]